MTLWAQEYGTMFDELTDLREIAGELSPDARRVLLRIARRMRQGQKEYGQLDLRTDTRNWRQEINEELMDALVYSACEEEQKCLTTRASQ